MLIIILLIGNAGLLVYSSLALIMNITDPNLTEMLIVVIPVVILSILNIYFIIGIYRWGSVSLYLKRKKLEEEIKIKEAENKLQNLQSQGSDSLKEKTL